MLTVMDMTVTMQNHPVETISLETIRTCSQVMGLNVVTVMAMDMVTIQAVRMVTRSLLNPHSGTILMAMGMEITPMGTMPISARYWLAIQTPMRPVVVQILMAMEHLTLRTISRIMVYKIPTPTVMAMVTKQRIDWMEMIVQRGRVPQTKETSTVVRILMAMDGPTSSLKALVMATRPS